jgi:serine O-acetyltransferase
MSNTIPSRLELSPVAKRLAAHHKAFGRVPDLHTRDASTFLSECMALIFPHLAYPHIKSDREIEARLTQLIGTLRYVLCESVPRECERADGIAYRFIARLGDIAETVRTDAEAIFEGDPAADSLDEVILGYPGCYAIGAYRVAHALHEENVGMFARLITEHAHWLTGIDIHPGATIGSSFAIDHGTGVVIGETAVIGNHVRIYQGVTLGALKVSRTERDKKRHPTIEDNVIIYSGATILGGGTVVGSGTIIGGNVWLTRSVAPGSRVMYKPPEEPLDTPELDSPDLYVI